MSSSRKLTSISVSLQKYFISSQQSSHQQRANRCHHHHQYNRNISRGRRIHIGDHILQRYQKRGVHSNSWQLERLSPDGVNRLGKSFLQKTLVKSDVSPRRRLKKVRFSHIEKKKRSLSSSPSPSTATDDHDITASVPSTSPGEKTPVSSAPPSREKLTSKHASPHHSIRRKFLSHRGISKRASSSSTRRNKNVVYFSDFPIRTSFYKILKKQLEKLKDLSSDSPSGEGKQSHDQHGSSSSQKARKRTYWSIFDYIIKVLSLPVTTSLLYYTYDRRQTFVKFLEEHSDERYKRSLRTLLVFYNRNDRDSQKCVDKFFSWHYCSFSKLYENVNTEGLQNDPEFQEYLCVNDSLTHIWDFSSRMHQIRNSSALKVLHNLGEEKMLGSTHLIVMSRVICPIELSKPRDREGQDFTSEMCAQFKKRFQSMEREWNEFMLQNADHGSCVPHESTKEMVETVHEELNNPTSEE